MGKHTVTTKRDGEYRTTLRLSRIKELRPDYSHKQALDRAESLASYTNDQLDATLTAANMETISVLPDLLEESLSAEGYHRLENGSSIEVFWQQDFIDDPARPSLEEAADTSGWYWWACQPDCLPDGDPVGPFNTSDNALADAKGDF